MKQVLLSFLFSAFLFFVQAQETKPSKEVTQKFLSKILSQVVGNLPWEGAPQPIQKQVLNMDFTNYTMQTQSDETYKRTEFINIPWEDITTLDVTTNRIVSWININFKSKMEYRHHCCFVDEDKGVPLTTNYEDQMRIYVLTDNVESCKKALLRLSEIAKEENKDPFKN